MPTQSRLQRLDPFRLTDPFCGKLDSMTLFLGSYCNMKTQLATIALSLILSVILPLPSLAGTVLEDIKRTGVLKAGIRQDAPPLGFVSADGKWEGYCIELMELLGKRLQEQLQLSQPIEVKFIPSTLENREQLVKDGKVHLECGPNTIMRNPQPGITYSDRFLATGVHLLVRPDNQSYILPSGALENISIGVLPNSLTQQFISSRYSLAKVVEYPGVDGRKNAVEDVIQGRLNAFASDGLLLVGEVLRNPSISTQDYALVPQEPLTCEFYGMILPQGDLSWINTVNSLILVEETVNILTGLYGKDSEYVKTLESAHNKCLL